MCQQQNLQRRTQPTPSTQPPTPSPTNAPTTQPPTQNPTDVPTTEPPTPDPTNAPSTKPPTPSPTNVSSTSPTIEVTASPTEAPPTDSPTPNQNSTPTTFAPTEDEKCGIEDQKSKQCGAKSTSNHVETCCPGLICNVNYRCVREENYGCGGKQHLTKECGSNWKKKEQFAPDTCCPGFVCDFSKKRCVLP